ncbi:MAG: TetR/AcrR family transcriptional regulator [Microbacteriaceae bacterium]
MTDEGAPRGHYAKGIERREAILRTTLELFAHHGARGASLRAVARELGVSPALLQHYFGSREQLLQEVVAAWDADSWRLTGGRGVLAGWLLNIRRNVGIPGLVRVYASASVDASDPAHPSRKFFAERYGQLAERLEQEVREQQSAGLAAPDLDPERVARLLIAGSEGLQIRWLHDDGFDMAEEFSALVAALGLTVPAED